MSVADEIQKLNALREQGILTDEEFAQQKRVLLGGGTSPPPQRSPEPMRSAEQAPPRAAPTRRWNEDESPRPPRPANGLTAAIFVTLFCCLPLGVVAIVKAAAVNSAYDAGRFGEATRLAAETEKWTIASAILGCAGIGIWFLLFLR